MSDDANRRDGGAAADDAAFWEDEGGDRTITSPFEPPPHLPPLEQPGTVPLAFGVLGSDLPPALPPSEPPHHVVVGSDGVGDEATLAVPAPNVGSHNIAAALAATLGAVSLPQPEVWSPPPNHGPMTRPHGPPGGALPPSGASPVAMTMAGPPSSPMGPAAHPPYPSSGAMAARVPYPSSGALPAGPGPGGPWPAPGVYTAPAGPPPHAVTAPGPPPRPVAPAGSSGRTNIVLLAVFGVVCLTIFVVGVVLFLRTNF